MNEGDSAYDEAVAAIRARSSHQPRMGLVLGSVPGRSGGTRWSSGM